MFQSAFSCHYWTPLANALMLWDYILGMKCFDTLMFILSKVRELKNVYTNAFVNYKNISVFYITCTHLFLHRSTKIIHKIQVHIRQFRNICHVLFSSLLVVEVEIVLSLQSAILLHPTLSLDTNAHLGPSTLHGQRTLFSIGQGFGMPGCLLWVYSLPTIFAVPQNTSPNNFSNLSYRPG